MAGLEIAEDSPEAATEGLKKKVKNKKFGYSYYLNSNFLRRLVSTNKIRINAGKYDLDLTYITNRVIACGFPADGFERMYRNSRHDINAFLYEMHGNMVKIYNLCAEPKYQYS